MCGRGASTVQLAHEGQLDRGQALLKAVRRIQRRHEIALVGSPGGRVEAGRHGGLGLLQRIDHSRRLEHLYDTFRRPFVVPSERIATPSKRAEVT